MQIQERFKSKYDNRTYQIGGGKIEIRKEEVKKAIYEKSGAKYVREDLKNNKMDYKPTQKAAQTIHGFFKAKPTKGKRLFF